jgi:NADH-quinone oxidoreductase E subunit
MEKVICRVLSKYPVNARENLLPILQEIQKACGHLSDQSLEMVGKHLNLPSNKLYGVATFYDEFRFVKQGEKHIKVCQGTSCHVEQSAAILSRIESVLKIKTGQTRKDGKFSIELVSCLGACSKAPVISINGSYYSGLTTEKLDKLLASLI